MTSFILKHWEIFGGTGLMLVLSLLIYQFYYRRFIFREQELLANGLGLEKEAFIRGEDGFLKRKIAKKAVKGFYDKKNQKFVLTKFNSAINDSTISTFSPTIEKITKKRVMEARVETKFFSDRAVFYLENFKEKINLSALESRKLLTGDFFTGVNSRGEALVNSTIKDFNWTTTVVGGQGSGKTTTMISHSFTYLYSFIDNNEIPPRLFIVDIKKTDFLPLINHFKDKTEVRFFNPLNLEDITSLNQEIENYLSNCLAFFKYLADKDVSVRHWQELGEEYKANKPHSICFLFDEVPSYLSAVPIPKIGKDPTPNEITAHDEARERGRLALLLTKMFNTLRPTGTTIWLGSQTGSVSDLNIPFNNLRSHFLMSKTTGATGQIWGIPQELATRSDLSKGLFIYGSPKGIGVLKTPFIEVEKIGGKK